MQYLCNTCLSLHVLCSTFSFLQFILPAVALASDQLPLLQASLERAQSEHVEASVLPWKQSESRASVLQEGYSLFAISFLASSHGQTMALYRRRITRRLLKTLSEALSQPTHSHDKCLRCHHIITIKTESTLFVNIRVS